jgi:hypothetical protein
MPLALEWCWNVTSPFTPAKYGDEMHGIADGATAAGAQGVTFQQIAGINMVAEIIKAQARLTATCNTAVPIHSTPGLCMQCTIIGANRAATSASKNGTLIHLRTLDGMGGATMPIKARATRLSGWLSAAVGVAVMMAVGTWAHVLF